MKKQTKANIRKLIVSLVCLIIIGIGIYFNPGVLNEILTELSRDNGISYTTSLDLSSIPEYCGTPFVVLNGDKPDFNEDDYTTEPFERYSDLDKWGRCGVAYANICKEIMPAKDEERESISDIEPSGWESKTYKGVVEGNYLYHRCHLIARQLAGENANRKNLITGTRDLNIEGMLPFENDVVNYLNKNENNHVLYRVTPIYEGDNLIASGVQMEACSVEDNGKGLHFNVYVYNVQPGIIIDYATGKSKLAE